jgi:hypothetical protein
MYLSFKFKPISEFQIIAFPGSPPKLVISMPQEVLLGSEGTVIVFKYFHIYLPATLNKNKRLYIGLLRIMQK